ncbi:hypothetical protein CDL15_Pgr017571 [Punica granatum]|uniref:Uncharacterized protein n=1 Tax=Punica granatum TaxID=22663 RepID=A0A218W636_PUNGR|nr:hypothetical protein CDL15_Pgr017571 [Punica granatum]
MGNPEVDAPFVFLIWYWEKEVVISHEVSIAELSNLSSSRAVYVKTGNLYFRTNIQKAKALEQNQLESAKAKLEKLNAS